MRSPARAGPGFNNEQDDEDDEATRAMRDLEWMGPEPRCVRGQGLRSSDHDREPRRSDERVRLRLLQSRRLRPADPGPRSGRAGRPWPSPPPVNPDAPPPTYATSAAQFEQVDVIASSYAQPTEQLPSLVGYDQLTTGEQVPVVVYVHTYQDPIDTYARVRWAGRWYYNVQGSLVYWSDFYGGWVSYYSPPIYLTWAWNWYYPWIAFGWGCGGYYGCGWYWGGPGYYGWHAYGRPPGWYGPGVTYPPPRPARPGRPINPGVPAGEQPPVVPGPRRSRRA